MSATPVRLSDQTNQDSVQSQAVLTIGTDWLVQLLYWSLLIGLIPVTMGIALPAGMPSPGPSSNALTAVFPCVIGVSIACYAWIRFASSRQLRWLLGALAFGSFAAFEAAHVVTVAVAGSQPYASLASDWFSALARISAAALLLVGALTRRKTRTPWSLRLHVNSLLCCLGIVLGTVIGLLYLARYSLNYVGQGQTALLYLVRLGPYCVGAVICLVAISVYAKRTIAWQDRTSKVVCLWLFPTAMSCAVYAVSPTMSAASWWQAHLFDMAAAAVAAVGLNIDSAMSRADSSERLAGLQAMHDISWSLAAAANLSTMLYAFVEVLGNATGARLVALYLLDQEGRSLRLEAVHTDSANNLETGASYSISPESRPGFHGGHTARALKERAPQVVQDVYSDVEFLPWRMVAQHDGWVVSIPLLLHHDTAVGVLNLYLAHERHVAPEKINLLETMAGLVAPAIENRRNYMELAAVTQRKESMSEEYAADQVPEAA